MVNITNVSSVLRTRGWVSVASGSNGISKIQESILTAHSVIVVVSAAVPTAMSCKWIFNFFLSRDKRCIQARILSQLWLLEVSLPLCVMQHIMGTWPNSLPFSGSLSTPCVIFFLSALRSLVLFSLRGPKARLCALLTRSLFIWVPRLAAGVIGGSHRLMHCLSSALFPVIRPPPACLVQLNTHKGLNCEGQTELFWSQSNRKSMEEGFLFSERGR